MLHTPFYFEYKVYISNVWDILIELLEQHLFKIEIFCKISLKCL